MSGLLPTFLTAASRRSGDTLKCLHQYPIAAGSRVLIVNGVLLRAA